MSAGAVEGLRATHADLAGVLAGLADDQWSAPSGCAGWRVHDVLAHVTSNFAEIVEPSPQPPGPPPEMTAEQAMEALVAPRRDWTPTQLLDEYERFAEPALATLAVLQDEPVASAPLTVADLGTYQTHQLADAFCFDHYCHLRHDLLAPGGPLAAQVPPPDDLRLAPGIGWMLAGLPQMCSASLAPVLTAPVVLDLSGPGGGTWTVQPAGDGGLVSIEDGAVDPAATVRSSAHDFVSWGTKRSAWRDACEVSGDEALASAVLDRLDII